MTDARALVVAVDAFTVQVQVVVVDPEGIRKVVVRDAIGATLADRDIRGCPREVAFDLGSVARDRLPLTITGLNCHKEPGGTGTGEEFTSPPLLGEFRTADPEGRLLCRDDPTFRFCPENPACREAERTLQRQRNLVLEQCVYVAEIRERRDAWAAVAAAAAIALAVFLGIAAAAAGVPFIGQALAAVALVLALIAAAALGIALFGTAFYQRQLQDASLQLRRRQQDFIATADQVLEHCCPHCITVDTTLPGCT